MLHRWIKSSGHERLPLNAKCRLLRLAIHFDVVEQPVRLLVCVRIPGDVALARGEPVARALEVALPHLRIIAVAAEVDVDHLGATPLANRRCRAGIPV